MSTSEDIALHYRLMFTENSAVMLLINPNDGRIVDASQGACQYYGYSLSDLMAMTIFDINTMSKDEIAVEMQRAKEESENHFNFRHRLASGEVRDVEVYSNPVSMEGQKFLYSIIHDVTERKQSERKLQESEARFRKIFENTEAISVQGYDKNRQVIYWNSASEKLYGYTADNAIGQKLEDLIIPDTMREPVIAAIAAWLHGGPSIPSSELTLSKADGTPVQVYSSHIMLRNYNNEPEMYCIDIDLTKLKRAEAQARKGKVVLDSIFQTLPDLFFTIDMDGTIRDYHASKLSELYLPPESFVGKRIQDVLPSSIATQFEENIGVVEKKAGVATFEYTLGLPHGLRHYEARLSQLPDNSQLVAVVRDITERKQAEAKQVRLERELLQAQEMQSLGQLTGGIAHDFNNILSIILGYTDLALKYVVNDSESKLVEYLEQVETAGGRGKQLVAQMQTFSRSKEGDTKPLHLQPLVKQDLKMLRSTLPTSIEINTNIEAELPAVRLDPVKLNQLLMNLCVNARDAMEGKGEISVYLGWARGVEEECNICHQSLEGDWVELSVRDTGSGISPDVLEHIFEPFYTTKEVGKGTGMGLAMICGIMGSCNGHTLVETDLGNGTTFRLLFPPLVEEESEIASTEQSLDEIPHGAGE